MKAEAVLVPEVSLYIQFIIDTLFEHLILRYRFWEMFLMGAKYLKKAQR